MKAVRFCATHDKPVCESSPIIIWLFFLRFVPDCFLFFFSGSNAWLKIGTAQHEPCWNSFMKCFSQPSSFQAIIQIHCSTNKYDEYLITDTQLNWKLFFFSSFQQKTAFAHWKSTLLTLCIFRDSSSEQVGFPLDKEYGGLADKLPWAANSTERNA